MTKQQYLTQLKKWFVLIDSGPDEDHIDQKIHDKYFFPVLQKIPHIPLIDGCGIFKTTFIKFCYDNNLCDKTLDEAYLLWRLSLD